MVPTAIETARRRASDGVSYVVGDVIRLRSVLEGVTQAEVEAAFPAWDLLAVDAADTAGLGWPMNRSAPQWYRLRRADQAGDAAP